MNENIEGSERMADPRIEVRRNCTLVHSALTSDMLRAISGDLPAGSILDMHLARLTGAQFAMGLPDDVARLTRAMEPIARRRVDEAFPDQPSNVREWLAVGRHSPSSQTLFTRLTGLVPPGASASSAPSYPHDSSDLARCRTMLEFVPEVAANLRDAVDLCPEWAALIERWDSICEAMDEECPTWRDGCSRTPMTRNLIDEALRDARALVRMAP